MGFSHAQGSTELTPPPRCPTYIASPIHTTSHVLGLPPIPPPPGSGFVDGQISNSGNILSFTQKLHPILIHSPFFSQRAPPHIGFFAITPPLSRGGDSHTLDSWVFASLYYFLHNFPGFPSLGCFLNFLFNKKPPYRATVVIVDLWILDCD